MGQDIDSLSLKELQSLEHQLDVSLKHIRLRRDQLMNESIATLQKKDKALQERNNLLSKTIKERARELPGQHSLEIFNSFNFSEMYGAPPPAENPTIPRWMLDAGF
ncbi:hypothetical protein M569_08314 [Genlisea aurea]|uniref:K-box domain-containing protein n=1 Tax=Genlisea aurea TaxID=192259 RepID=S8DTI3_9LAMI|nr:hypothetical protein M569_08314 [Genlisea aurea]